MQIRRAGATDEAALARIRQSAILALTVPAMSREQAEQWAARAGADRIARAIRDHDVWVAVDGVAIGWVEVDRDRVAALYVSPSSSRRGVGSVLLARAEASIRGSGYVATRLESSPNALDFYVRRGYVRYGPPDAEGAYPLRKDLTGAGGMGDGVKRSELTARIRAARAEFEDLLAGLGPDEMTHPGVAGDWSVKDILAHIAWYEAEEARFYGETDVEGSPLWRVPQDPRNQMLFEEARERSLEQVLAEFRSGHERFLKVIEALSEEDLATPGRFPGTSAEWPPWRRIAAHSCDHDREHLDMIRAWLGTRYRGRPG